MRLCSAASPFQTTVWPGPIPAWADSGVLPCHQTHAAQARVSPRLRERAARATARSRSQVRPHREQPVARRQYCVAAAV